MTLSYALVPLAFLLMPFASFQAAGAGRVLAYAIGAAFWTGVVTGTVFLVKMEEIRKSDKKRGCVKGLPGILSFFRTKRGSFIDKLLLPTAAATIVASAAKLVPHRVSFVLWAATLTLLILHSAVNGKNFIYMNGNTKG